MSSIIDLHCEAIIEKLIIINNKVTGMELKQIVIILLFIYSGILSSQSIEHMNHIFKEIQDDETQNMASYNNPDLPVMKELITGITNFIANLNP